MPRADRLARHFTLKSRVTQRDKIMQNIRSLLIATPTTGGIIKAKTAETLSNLVKVLTKLDIDTQVHIINNSDIVTARNIYANMVLNSDKWDALLFIDSDMSFRPAVILRLIKTNALVCGVACTKKLFELDKFANSFVAHNDVELARAESAYFNTLISWGDGPRKIQRTEGFFTAAAVGMGVCLIKRQALEVMVAQGVVEKRFDIYEGTKRTSWGFFDYTKHQDITLTEDYAFCYRWTKLLGKPLWVCTDAKVDHIGDFHYGGNYSLIFENLVRPLPPTERKHPETGDSANANSTKVATKRRQRASEA